MLIVKLHKNTEGKLIVAICDKGLVGKKFEENGLQLDLSSDFYKGDEKSESELKLIVKSAYLLNITGKNSVEFALKNSLVEKNSIITICKIPHAETLFSE